MTLTISLFVFGGILLGYFRSTEFRKTKSKIGIGLTTELAAGAVFCLGYMTIYKPLLSAIIGVGILLLLLGREQLHKFAREQIQPKEIQAAVTILVVSISVISFLPNYAIDSWGIFNPQRFGVLIVLLALMQFGGYLAIRLFGHQLGLIFMGFFGGLISSTAVFAALPRYSRSHPLIVMTLVAAALFAMIGMLAQLLVIIFAASPVLMREIFWPVLAMILIALFGAFIVARKNAMNGVFSEAPNPLDFKSVLKLAIFIGGIIITVALAQRYVGLAGMKAVIFLGGLFELRGAALAIALLFSENKIQVHEAVEIIGYAVLATFSSKFFLLWVLGRNYFALVTSLFLFCMLAAGISVLLFLNAITNFFTPIH